VTVEHILQVLFKLLQQIDFTIFECDNTVVKDLDWAWTVHFLFLFLDYFLDVNQLCAFVGSLVALERLEVDHNQAGRFSDDV